MSTRISIIPKSIRNKIILDSNGICFWCKEKQEEKNIEIDHLIPYALGGDECIENLVCSCKRCNKARIPYTRRLIKQLPKRIELVKKYTSEYVYGIEKENRTLREKVQLTSFLMEQLKQREIEIDRLHENYSFSQENFSDLLSHIQPTL